MDLPLNYLDIVKRRSHPLKITSERQELIQSFVDRINRERAGTRFKPVTARQINTLLSFLDTRDLYWLFRKCEREPSFSKKFFGVLRDTKINCRAAS